LYQRHDCTVLTASCPVGLRAVTRRLSRIAGAILSFVVPNFGVMPPAAAQSYRRINVSNAALQLEVTDIAGTPIADADVVMIEQSAKQEVRGKTDKQGRALLRGSRGGRYILSVSLAHFATSTDTIELRPGEILSLRVPLRVGALMGEVVMVDPGSKPSRNSVPLPPSMSPGAAPKPMQ
jgi:hypothetical protein